MYSDHTNRPLGIKYISLADSTGYGIAAKRYLKALSQAGIPLTWTPMVPGRSWGLGYQPYLGKSVGDPDLDRLCNRQIEYDTVILHLMPEYFPLWINLEPGKRIIGYTVWETDQIPLHWRPLLNSVNALFVPCKWNQEIFELGGVQVPIRVIPHIAAEPDLAAGSQRNWGIRPDDFVFYTINVWSERKNNASLIEAYLQTFQANDPVTLLMKTSFRDSTKYKPGIFWRYFQSLTLDSIRKRVNAIRRRFPSPARIKLIARHLSDQDIMAVHRRGDCYVSLIRSEGWGLGAFDAAAYGKPVIITGYGGQLDYLPADQAYLVNYNLVPVQTNLSSYTSDQNWAEPDLDHGSKRMREVYNNQSSAQRQGERLADNIQQYFNQKKIINQLIAALQETKYGP